MPSADPARFWLRFPDERTRCPACESPRIVLLHAFKIPRDSRGRRVAFLSGCRVCGLVFANPLPAIDELQRHYARGGRYVTARLGPLCGPQRVRNSRNEPHSGPELLFSALDPHVSLRAPRPGAKALDFGCGTGKYLDWLRDRGWATYGIEPSTDAAFERHHRLESPPQDRSFDLVLLHHVLEHMTDPLDVLRRLAGALREGGWLIVSVPRFDTLPEHGDFKYCIDGRNHVVAFTETCLRGLLARAGFPESARVDAPELDRALQGGKPLRLRVVARRGAATAPADLAAAPLAPAVHAWSRFVRARDGLRGSARRLLPIRLRAALLDHAIERRARARRLAKVSASRDA